LGNFGRGLRDKALHQSGHRFFEPHEQRQRRRPSFRFRLDGGITFSLEICNLQQQQFSMRASSRSSSALNRLGSGRPSPIVSPSKSDPPIFVQRIITGDSLAGEQAFDSILEAQDSSHLAASMRPEQ
jgi:hypothetical protein